MPIPETKPIDLELTPLGALDLLLRCVSEAPSTWTPVVHGAIVKSREVIQRERDRLSQLAIDMMKPEQHTCADFLGLARDSMDAAVAELQAAIKNRTCGGLASLLLLDLICESSTMAARIRAVLAAASNEAEGVDPASPAGSRKTIGLDSGKGTEEAE